MTTPEAIEKFITRWQSAGGSERANYQLEDGVFHGNVQCGCGKPYFALSRG